MSVMKGLEVLKRDWRHWKSSWMVVAFFWVKKEIRG